ncbi:tRNA lysidine(34) synthetase TilS [Erwinia sp. S43]|uniref:tRNA lysidine(34) synthetase TilS n=1 Tax=unclassified Erwinia TaxID=2622719 RepID=UPI00190A6D23|nr:MULTISPECIES: tRNA lysidine(34) synthetase TilS [unclassified Erwinia]MBK0034948.1 tRNA lysidine(34) synthetase TilS [Erwinia sp. S43]MCW1875454.1 tRNA lysidine(34) synthetase TilS [Erwinia sp. INIA01]
MSDLAHLERSLTAEQPVLLAYSGGLDSTVLLHQLVQLRQQWPTLRLRALHVHHGLSPLADGWVAHCRRQCAEWQVPLEVVKVTVDARLGGIESAARSARYQALAQHIDPEETLLTAQHRDDQSETLLLALKRGSGPAGLAAMSPVQMRGDNLHLRPLLDFSRQQLEAWAARHRLSWIEDESNQDTRYDRNFLRLEILPLLNERWPHFSAAAARSAALCGEQEQLLDELLAESLDALIAEDGSLGFTPLLSMSPVRRAALLRRWIARQNGAMPSREGLERLWQEVVLSREDATPCLRLGVSEVRRFRDRLWWLRPSEPLADRQIDWAAPWLPLTLPAELGQLAVDDAGISLRQPQSSETVSVRFQARGSFHIVGRAGSRPLKKLWQEAGIPPWRRERIPLLFYGEQLIAALGVFVTHEGAPSSAETAWRIRWQQ